MSTEQSPGVITDQPLPPDPTPMTLKTQWPNQPCDPIAIHDKYPPIGTRPGESFKP